MKRNERSRQISYGLKPICRSPCVLSTVHRRCNLVLSVMESSTGTVPSFTRRQYLGRILHKTELTIFLSYEYVYNGNK
eukprot:scaffold7091_cov273-Chaetoceros_neogracile.AAC.11